MKIWNRIKEHRFSTIICALIIIASLWAAYLHFVEKRPWAGWTGIEAYTAPDGTYYPAKNLWDLLELLIIPAFIGGGAAWLNWQEKTREQKLAQERWEKDQQLAQERAEREQELAQDQQCEEALQSYLDKMTELLLKEKLLEKKDSVEDPAIDVAQIRTVTTLRILDNNRRNIVIQFLRDANLASFILIKAALSDANLESTWLFETDLTCANLSRAKLSRSDLREINLSGAKLIRANLAEAEMIMADLEYADLREANLSGANLVGARLHMADLSGANLSGASLAYADLSRASLRKAIGLTEEQLSKVMSLENATMPDGTIHE